MRFRLPKYPFAILAGLCIAAAPLAVAAPAHAAPPPASTDVFDDMADALLNSAPAQQFTAPSTVVNGPLRQASTFDVFVRDALSWPVPQGVMTSGFGPRTCSAGPCSSFHQGLDLTPGAGTPIKSVSPGVVIQAGPNGKFGYSVTIQHRLNGVLFTSVYAHMQAGSVQVSVGEQVSQGTFIGKVGNTGQSYGAHLHFEVHVNGSPVNPGTFMAEHDAKPYPDD